MATRRADPLDPISCGEYGCPGECGYQHFILRDDGRRVTDVPRRGNAIGGLFTAADLQSLGHAARHTGAMLPEMAQANSHDDAEERP